MRLEEEIETLLAGGELTPEAADEIRREAAKASALEDKAKALEQDTSQDPAAAQAALLEAAAIWRRLKEAHPNVGNVYLELAYCLHSIAGEDTAAFELKEACYEESITVISEFFGAAGQRFDHVTMDDAEALQRNAGWFLNYEREKRNPAPKPQPKRSGILSILGTLIGIWIVGSIVLVIGYAVFEGAVALFQSK